VVDFLPPLFVSIDSMELADQASIKKSSSNSVTLGFSACIRGVTKYKATMSNILKGLTYSYHRNIGWQDRAMRTIFGLLAMAGAIYLYPENFTLSIVLGVLFLAQVVTVFSSRCPICYFMGVCTITASEKRSFTAKGIEYEK
jgi:hypothetical protein